MRWKIEYGTYATSSSAAACGARQASTASPAIAMATTIHPSGGAAHGPTSDAMMPSAIRRGVGLLRKHVEAGELLRGLAGEGRAIRREPAAGDEERNRPREHADRERHRAAEQRAGRSASRAIEQHQRPAAAASARSSACACRRRAPQSTRRHNQSARLRDRRRRPRWFSRSAPHERRREARLRGERHAEPGMSLSGRSAVNQNSGDATTTSVASAARRSRVGIGRRAIQRFDASEQRHQRKHRQRAEQRAPAATTSLASDGHDRVRQFAERDEDGISGRMRLMLRRIEIAHAEREVHRVEIFERRRKKREVRDEKDRRERGRPEQLSGRVFKPGGGSDLRSGCRCGSPSDRSSPTRSRRPAAPARWRRACRARARAADPRAPLDARQRVVMTHAADAEPERVQRVFAALDLPQLLRRHFVMIRNARRQARRRRLVPHGQPGEPRLLANLVFRHAGFVERAPHAELLRRDAAGPIVAAIVGVRAVGDVREAALARELRSAACRARACRSSSGSRDSRGTRRARSRR